MNTKVGHQYIDKISRYVKFIYTDIQIYMHEYVCNELLFGLQKKGHSDADSNIDKRQEYFTK